MSIDWDELEDRLYELSVAEIKRFAARHRKEKFYGFAFVCNSAYGTVALYLNTPEFLRTAANGSHLSPEIREGYEKFTRDIEEALGFNVCRNERDVAPEDREKEIRWEPGDWKYDEFNSDTFDLGWSPFARAVHEYCLEEEEDKGTFMTPTQDRFMRSACRVLIRLESTGVFEALNRTSDFGTFVTDHDESDEKSWRRLNSVRKETRDEP